MMSDPWRDVTGAVTGPAIGAFAVTPNNDGDLPNNIRAVTIGGGGTISYDFRGTTWTTGPLPAGTHVFRATRIRATGTTATQITGWV